ncbi:MAG: DUF3108 domain-containing protein [Pyrinomonadaceae bacterium]|nr:DUF3108 domain-containing protein [Pyrinomonadaceae bacterium]
MMIAIAVVIMLLSLASYGQTANAVSGDDGVRLRVGERLSYSVTYEKFQDVAHLETQVVSSGTMGGKRVFELYGRVKTFEIVSAALSLIDEGRTVFVSADSGLPVLVKKTRFSVVVPTETVENYSSTPAAGHDLLSLIYAIRSAGGQGSFNISENGETYPVSVQTAKPERIKTAAGEFDTVNSVVSGSYFDLLGIKNLNINFAVGDDRLPALIRFRMPKGSFRVELSNVQYIEPPQPEVTPTPTPVATPRPSATPRPQPTATPYVPNQPLLPELAFSLGEVLEYKLSAMGQSIGTMRFEAKERTLFQNRDSLLLSASITGVDQGNSAFVLGDILSARVDPETLAPLQAELKAAGNLKPFNQTATFDPRSGAIRSGPNPVEAPVGTHSLISLIYAMRSFNLEPSKSPGSPVNDTRVAVFWTDRPYIFTLRPGNPETISLNGNKVTAQLITINTGNPQLDQLAIKVWLSTKPGRRPLRFAVGAYQADLVTQ